MSIPGGFGGDCGLTEMMKCIPLIEIIWWTKSPWFQTYPRGVEAAQQTAMQAAARQVSDVPSWG